METLLHLKLLAWFNFIVFLFLRPAAKKLLNAAVANEMKVKSHYVLSVFLSDKITGIAYRLRFEGDLCVNFELSINDMRRGNAKIASALG